MRRNFLASTALTTSSTLIAGAALAADWPVKAPPLPAVAPFSWSGCYFGANAGGGRVSIDQSVTTAAPFLPIRTFDSTGHDTSFTGGGQLGCNWQFNPSWVVGLEGDINYIHGSRSQSFTFRGEDTVQQTRLRWLATVRARFGYAWGPSYLYATGGLALGDVKSSVTVAGTSNHAVTYSGSSSATRAGWTVGAGFEHAFTNRLSLKLEYLHFDLGEADYSVPRVDGAARAPWTASAKVSGDIVRAGFNYKFTP